LKERHWIEKIGGVKASGSNFVLFDEAGVLYDGGAYAGSANPQIVYPTSSASEF